MASQEETLKELQKLNKSFKELKIAIVQYKELQKLKLDNTKWTNLNLAEQSLVTYIDNNVKPEIVINALFSKNTRTSMKKTIAALPKKVQKMFLDKNIDKRKVLTFLSVAYQETGAQ